MISEPKLTSITEKSPEILKPFSNIGKTAVIFTSDIGYIIPTLVAARQVAVQIGTGERCKVIIFLLDITQELQMQLASQFPDFLFIPMENEMMGLKPGAHFNPTHVPRSAMARLSAGRMIPESFDNVVYLDGDIQIVGDITPLLSHVVPDGKILAGCDHADLSWGELGRYTSEYRNYVRSLGLSSGRDYFNSGVLAARRQTWIDLTSKALEFYNHNSSTCRYHDQSALNAVCRDHRVFLHPRYNFVSWFRYAGCEALTKPAIIHFTGGAKPWANRFPSERGRYRRSYDDLIGCAPFLMKAFAETSSLNPAYDSEAYLGLGWRLPWRIPARRHRFKRYLKEAPFAFD